MVFKKIKSFLEKHNKKVCIYFLLFALGRLYSLGIFFDVSILAILISLILLFGFD